MKKQEVIFDSYDHKKNSVCYKTSQSNPAVTSIYLMRTALSGSAVIPKKLKVTIEEVE